MHTSTASHKQSTEVETAGAPPKGKKQLQRKPAENAAAHDSKAQQKQHNTTKHNNAPYTTAQEPNPTQARHTTPGTTPKIPQTAAPDDTKHHKAQHRTPQPAGGGRTTSGHTISTKENPRKAPEGGCAGNTTQHPPEAAWGRATPPALRHPARATQQATPQEEEAQAGSTEQQSATRHRLPPKHKAHNNAHQHGPQPRTHHPSTAQPAHHGTENEKKKARREKGKENRQKKNAGGRRKKRGKKRKKQKRGGGTRRQGQRPPGPENTERQRQGGHTRGKKNAGTTKSRGTPARGGSSRQWEHQEQPQERVSHTKTRPGGQPARPGQESVASSDPKGAVSASTQKSPGAPAESPVERRTVQETR